jgi:glutathione S-transferase
MARTLIIGNKTFSSWSLRPWIGLRAAGLPFDERRIALGRPETAEELARHTPTGKVPVLLDGDLVIPESLAILEYAAELAPEAGLLPEDIKERARCRAAAAEMHAGFGALRGHCPMNLRRQGKPRAAGLPAQVVRDCARIETIWRECRERSASSGPFLFGRFTIADAMFAPVVTRFVSYALPRSAASDAYIEAILDFGPFREWSAQAAAETERHPETEGID